MASERFGGFDSVPWAEMGRRRHFANPDRQRFSIGRSPSALRLPTYGDHAYVASERFGGLDLVPRAQMGRHQRFANLVTQSFFYVSRLAPNGRNIKTEEVATTLRRPSPAPSLPALFPLTARPS